MSPASPVADRKQEERDFHDQRARDQATFDTATFERRYPNKKAYAITRKTKRILADWMSRYAPNATALDYCCGFGRGAIQLAAHGATAYGIDISAEEVAAATRAAADAGVGDRTHFSVMDAEHMTFPDSTFDLIICNGVLHHLDVAQAFPELSRVLKPSGRILCLESLGYNPLFQLYRDMTPRLRTAWEAKHILTLRQVRQAAPYFERVHVQYLYLFTLLAVPFRKTPLFPAVLRLLEVIDSLVLSLPVVRLMAWHMVFELSAPTGKGPGETAA